MNTVLARPPKKSERDDSATKVMGKTTRHHRKHGGVQEGRHGSTQPSPHGIKASKATDLAAPSQSSDKTAVMGMRLFNHEKTSHQMCHFVKSPWWSQRSPLCFRK
jgi:hypothetical protein